MLDAGGVQQAHYDYDPQGGLTITSGSAANGNPFRFDGRDDDGLGVSVSYCSS